MSEKPHDKIVTHSTKPGKFVIGCGILTLGLVLMTAIMFIAFISDKSPGVMVAFFRYGSSVTVFGMASFLVYRLWVLVLEALGGGSSVYARGLLQLLGNIGIDASTNEINRARVTGAGLLGTIVIILVAVIAIYFILRADIGSL